MCSRLVVLSFKSLSVHSFSRLVVHSFSRFYAYPFIDFPRPNGNPSPSGELEGAFHSGTGGFISSFLIPPPSLPSTR